jgi:ApaG protein
MYTAVTREIQVTVLPQYVAERSEPDESRFFWAYTIEVTNLGRETVHLTARHWRITDANGLVEEVHGPGVVGEQPVIPPGESFRYTSGCPLTTPSGIMMGSYRMVDEAGEGFDVEIPAFSLDCPFSSRTLN